jgi:hypothetical protein
LVLDGDAWRQCLGVIHGETIHRHQRSGRGSRKRKISGSEIIQWKDRESERWFRGIAKSQERLAKCEEVIHVTDREGDSYELIANLILMGIQFVIRVKCNTRKAHSSEGADNDWSTVYDVISKQEGLFEREVELSARKAKRTPRSNQAHPPRKMRQATLQFSATRVEIKRPDYIKHLPTSLQLNVVHVTEVNPPDDEAGVEWLIYTTEPITSQKDIERIVDMYRSRWTIEEFFHALKTGCIYEEREFEDRSALLNILALLLPVACMMLWIRSQARANPQGSACLVFNRIQLCILRQLYPNKLPTNANVGQVYMLIAALGGHKKSNGPPGFKILYRGVTKLYDLEEGWRMAQNQSKTSDNS